MKISSFITMTRPRERGDLYEQCKASAHGFSDEVVIVDGNRTWPLEFFWQTIALHFQKGYDAASGDWVIHLDTDYIFHEKDYAAIRKACEDNPNAPALTFYKHQFILPDRYNLKSRLVLAVNKGKYGSRIKFDGGGQGDLCQPSLDGRYIDPSSVPEARVPFWNYEKLIKTRKQLADDAGRMDRAYYRQFGRYQFSEDGSDEQAFTGHIKMLVGRFKKPQKHIPLSDHPKVMQQVIRDLTPEQWGYSGFGYLETNDYMKGGA